MLDYMRRRSRSAIIYLFFGIIIAVFIINFGPQSQGCQPSRVVTAAKVGGEAIDSTDLNMEYIRHFGMAARDRVDDDAYIAQRLESLQTVINVALLAQEARRMGFVVTSEELADYLKDPKRNPDFRSVEVDGKLDPQQYQRLVTAVLQSSMERYERVRSWELLARKLMDYYRSLIRVSEQEIDAANREKQTKVNLEFVAVRPADQQVPEEVDAAELQAWTEAHKAEIQAHYDEHRTDFDRPREAWLRQIFLRSPAGDPADARAVVKKKAEELRQQVVDGADMAELASSSSEHISYKSKGGDMGWQSEGNNDPAFDAAAFALKKGELSPVVETATGYYVIRAEDIKEAKKQTLEQATPEIGRKLIVEQRRVDAARKNAERMLAELKAGKSLQDLVEAETARDGEAAADAGPDLEVQETGDFTQEGKGASAAPESIFSFSRTWDQVPRIGKSKEVSLAAFALTQDAPVPDKVFQVNDTWYVMRLKSRSEPTQELSAEERDKLRSELLRNKERKLLGDWERTLFFPASPRMMLLVGGKPTPGPLLKGLLDRLAEQTSIYRNQDLFTLQREESEEVPEEAAAPQGQGEQAAPGAGAGAAAQD